jgi:hypothetical protein
MNHPPQPTDWEPCPPGRLQQQARQETQRIHRRRFLYRGGLGLAVLGVSGLSWLAYRSLQNEMNCQQAVDYLRNWATLDARLRERTLAHTRICPQCQQEMLRLGIPAKA